MQPAAPLRPFGKPCPGCGTALYGQGEYCAVCAAKPANQAPQAAWNLAPQPRPPYAPQPEQIDTDADDE